MFWKWIHEFNWLNSHEFTGFCEQIWCVDTCLPWNHEFFHVMTHTSETVAVLTQFWPSTTHVFKWIHMKTRTGGAVPIMNQYDTCQLVQKWFLVCWVYTHTIDSEACDRSWRNDVVYFVNTDINPSHRLPHLLAQLRQTSHQSMDKCASPPPSQWGVSRENVRACLYTHLVDFRMLLSCF